MQVAIERFGSSTDAPHNKTLQKEIKLWQQQMLSFSLVFQTLFYSMALFNNWLLDEPFTFLISTHDLILNDPTI